MEFYKTYTEYIIIANGVMMHMTFCEDVISYRRVSAIDLLNINEFVHLESQLSNQ